MIKIIHKATRVALFAITLSTTAHITNAQAQGQVAVSIPELHSLVSQLLHGVDTPRLLFSQPQQIHETLPSPIARAKLDEAQMVVWVGPRYETALAGLRAIDPGQSLKGLTLSATTPLLGLPDSTHPERSAGVADMRFWLDPRLAKVAIGRIAPNLTRLYPENADDILENEIALKKRLSALEMHFRHTLETKVGVPLHVPQSDVLYLAWRFNLTSPNCPGAADRAQRFDGAPGGDYYFKKMDAILSELKTCESRNL